MEEILGRGSNAFWWSPDGTRLAFMRFDDAPVPVFPIYHADGQHGTLERTRYPKPGDPNPYVRIGVVSIADGRTTWMDFEEKADHYLAFPKWSVDGRTLFVQWMNRGQDTLQDLRVRRRDGQGGQHPPGDAAHVGRLVRRPHAARRRLAAVHQRRRRLAPPVSLRQGRARRAAADARRVARAPDPQGRRRRRAGLLLRTAGQELGHAADAAEARRRRARDRDEGPRRAPGVGQPGRRLRGRHVDDAHHADARRAPARRRLGGARDRERGVGARLRPRRLGPRRAVHDPVERRQVPAAGLLDPAARLLAQAPVSRSSSRSTAAPTPARCRTPGRRWARTTGRSAA